MSGMYEWLFRNVAFPTYESLLRRRRTLAYMRAYEGDQWLSRDEIADLQWRRLKQLIEHCYQNVPYYRQRWTELGMEPGDIRDLGDYARLPVLTKDDIRDRFDALTANSWHGRLLTKATGGSTGEPMRFGYTRESYERRVAVMWRGYGWAGSRMGRRTLYLWGGAVGEQSRWQRAKEQLFSAAFARRTLNTFSMTEANIATYADAIDQYRPEVIVAYAGPLVRLSNWLIANGRTPHRPRTIISAAEALHEFQREIVEQAFGAPVYNTYGCREFMLIASECEHRNGLHVNADHLVLEVIPAGNDSPKGAPGELVVTDLFNFGMPFIRYVNGDMATSMEASCPCGRGLPMLRKIDGRVLDAIRSPDGHILPGEFFPHMFKDVRGVRRFQVVQRQADRLDITIVRNQGFEDSDLAYIRNEIVKVLGTSVDLNFDFVDNIPLTRSGKMRVTASDLSA